MEIRRQMLRINHIELDEGGVCPGLAHMALRGSANGAIIDTALELEDFRLCQMGSEQLARGGRMIIPVGPHGRTQDLKCIDKDAEGRVSERNLMGVQYVPLIDTGKPPPPQHGAAASGIKQA